jgi:beta-lactam-binding protein with PASTA domain/tRNA A-37 threonylcarbamoyl transferase component Bud32
VVTAVEDPLVGRLVDGRYVVRSRIARGGMATVYLATDTRLEREVALKVMHPHLADDQQFVARFHREAKSAARLSHAHVVAVFDQGSDGDVVYLAMEHVPGQTLRDLMLASGPMTPREAFDVLEPVLDALAAAHRAGIVHRDIKPENVLLADDGRVKVADFGLARAASASASGTTGMLIGTVAYLSPELVLRGVAGARSDVYAAGIMLFEMLTGRQPFRGEVPVQVAYRHVHEDVPPPSTFAEGLPQDVDDLVVWATARDPDERPDDAGELLGELRDVRGALSDDELDAAPTVTAEPAAPDEATLVVPRREHSLALPVGDPEPPGATHETRPVAAAADWGYGPGGRRRRRGLVALVAVLLTASLLGVAGWWFGAGPGAYTTTPVVEGKPLPEAKQLLDNAGLGSRIGERFDDAVPAGTVIESDPGSGEEVRKGGTVQVFVSAGPEFIPVPAVSGSTLDEARKTLTDAGLAAGDVEEQFSEDVEKGRVISQAVPAGETLRREERVDLVVSKGREPVDVPGVAGSPRADAEKKITDAGLAVGEVTSEASETVREGVVIRQEPPGGQLFRGDKVALVVSSGPPLVEVPRVRGMQLGQAERTLAAAGFKTKVEQLFGGIFGTVHSTDPAEGTRARKGSTVTIRIV